MDNNEPSFNEQSMLPDGFDQVDETVGEQTSDKEDTPPVEGEQQTTVDTPPETSDKEDPKEETTQDNELQELFEQMDLGRNYNDVREVLERIPEQRKYITQLEQQNAELKKAQAQETKPKVSQDEFYENPQESIRKLGYETPEQVQARINQTVAQAMATQRAHDFQKRTTDFQEMRPHMVKVLERFPSLGQAPIDESVQALYLVAKAMHPTSKPTTKVVPSDQTKADRAQTSGGKSTKTPSGLTPDQLLKMTPEQIEEAVGFGDS